MSLTKYVASFPKEFQGSANATIKRESRTSGPSGNQGFLLPIHGREMAERKVDAGVGLFEGLQGWREEVNRVATQVSRHSAAEKQNMEASTTCGLLAFQPNSAPAHC